MKHDTSSQNNKTVSLVHTSSRSIDGSCACQRGFMYFYHYTINADEETHILLIFRETKQSQKGTLRSWMVDTCLGLDHA